MDHEPVSQSPVFLGPPVDSRGLIVKAKLPVGAARTLHELERDYHFFTLAAPYLHGGFSDAFLIDYMYALGANVPIYYHKFNAVVFRGLETPEGDPSWNHVLFAVPCEFWSSLLDFICSLTVAMRHLGAMTRYGEQRLYIPDPLDADTAIVVQPGAALIRVSAFGLYGNRMRAIFTRGATLYEPHRLRFQAADSADIEYARAYFEGQNPLDARDAYVQKRLQDDQT